jgi:hypothetical protein
MRETQLFFAHTNSASPREEDGVAIALALHELTTWPLFCLFAYEVDFGARVLAAHAVVESPLGFFDRGGPNALERWWNHLSAQDEQGYLSLVDVAVRPVTAEYMRECSLAMQAGNRSQYQLATHREGTLALAREALERHGFSASAGKAARAG